MIKNVIFDMGNVLIAYEPDEPVEVFCKSEEAKAIIKRELFGGKEWIERDLGNISVEQLYKGTARRVPEKYHDELKACIDGWTRFMLPYEGGKEFCRKVKSMGYNIYILSNASTDFYDYFPKYYELDMFDGVVVSADIHMIKPDRAIYEYILEKYSLIPEECLFVDDREDNCLGARKAGINALQFSGDYAQIEKLLR